MNYQISYYSPEGYAAKMAIALQKALHCDSALQDLTEMRKAQADVQLIGFDFNQLDSESIPQLVRKYVRSLHGKTIFLFGTVPFQVNDVVDRGINQMVYDSLPDNCDYRGFFLCSAQPSDTLLDYFQEIFAENPHNMRVSHWYKLCLHAIGHPNAADIENLCSFASHVLHP